MDDCWAILPAVDPTFFPTAADFRAWLRRHHEEAEELWVGFYKKATGKPSLTWPESVDEALCVGWIDGLRKRLDDESYMIRFTPRRSSSRWSAVNVRKMERLLAEGRVLAAGEAAWDARPDGGCGYPYEARGKARLDAAYRERFEADSAAWEFFTKQPPWYRRTATHWVMSARREETRSRRLGILIASSAAGEAIPPLKRN